MSALAVGAMTNAINTAGSDIGYTSGTKTIRRTEWSNGDIDEEDI